MTPGKIHFHRLYLAVLLFGSSICLAQLPRDVARLDTSTGGGAVLDPAGTKTTWAPPCSTLVSILDQDHVLQTLERGETYLVEIDRHEKGALPGHALPESNGSQTGIAIATVQAKMAEVIEILADDDSFAEVFPYVAEVKSREVGEKTVVYQFVDLPFPIRNLWYEVLVERRREVTESGSCFESLWRYVPESGNIVDTEGRWELLERKDGALLIAYVAWAEAGGLIPRWAQNWAARRALPKIIEGLRAEIERRR